MMKTRRAAGVSPLMEPEADTFGSTRTKSPVIALRNGLERVSRSCFLML